jgi:hypothetical protein
MLHNMSMTFGDWNTRHLQTLVPRSYTYNKLRQRLCKIVVCLASCRIEAINSQKYLRNPRLWYSKFSIDNAWAFPGLSFRICNYGIVIGWWL